MGAGKLKRKRIDSNRNELFGFGESTSEGSVEAASSVSIA